MFINKKGMLKKHIIVALIVLAAAGTAFGEYYVFLKDNGKIINQIMNKEKDQEKPQEVEDKKTEENDETEKKEDQNNNKDKKSIEPTIKPAGDYTKLYHALYVTKPQRQVSPSKTIFLTFDDGPSARTPEVLDILKSNGIKATFFVIGNDSPAGKSLMKRIVAEGHTIAPHTYTHSFKKIYASVESYLEDFNKIYNLIYETTGQKPGIFRFAGGSKNSFNKNNYREIIAEMLRRGFYYYDWNLSTGDAAQKALTPAQTCISNVLNSSAHYSSAVVLMHDANAKTTTVAALQGIIDGLKSQGFKFDRLTPEIDPTSYSLIRPYA